MAGYDLSKNSTMTEGQDATIMVAVHNNDKIMKETELRDATVKKVPNLVKPRNESLVHPTEDLLKAYATEGYLENYGPDWSTYHIEAALCCGPHPLANSSTAMASLHAKNAENIKNGYSKVVRYGDINGNTPEKFKISPVAMIPHKSREFRTILDLSFRLKHHGYLMDYGNLATTEQAPE